MTFLYFYMFPRTWLCFVVHASMIVVYVCMPFMYASMGFTHTPIYIYIESTMHWRGRCDKYEYSSQLSELGYGEKHKKSNTKSNKSQKSLSKKTANFLDSVFAQRMAREHCPKKRQICWTELFVQKMNKNPVQKIDWFVGQRFSSKFMNRSLICPVWTMCSCGFLYFCNIVLCISHMFPWISYMFQCCSYVVWRIPYALVMMFTFFALRLFSVVVSSRFLWCSYMFVRCSIRFPITFAMVSFDVWEWCVFNLNLKLRLNIALPFGSCLLS